MLRPIVVLVLFFFVAPRSWPRLHLLSAEEAWGNATSAIRRYELNCRRLLSMSERIAGYSTASRIVNCTLSSKPTAQKSVQRLYWVQFEGYLPSRPICITR